MCQLRFMLMSLWLRHTLFFFWILILREILPPVPQVSLLQCEPLVRDIVADSLHDEQGPPRVSLKGPLGHAASPLEGNVDVVASAWKRVRATNYLGELRDQWVVAAVHLRHGEGDKHLARLVRRQRAPRCECDNKLFEFDTRAKLDRWTLFLPSGMFFASHGHLH